MRGRGTAAAVDEVPTRAPDFVVSLSNAYDIDLTANLSPALTRGAGDCSLSVGSRCPRLESVRRGKPLQPTPRCREAAGIRLHGGDGLRPAGDWEGAHPHPRTATLRSPEFGSVAIDICSLAPTSSALRPSPRRGRGTALAVDEVCDSRECPTLQVSPTFSGIKSFPSRGRGTACGG